MLTALQTAAQAMLNAIDAVDADGELDSRIDGTLIDNLRAAAEGSYCDVSIRLAAAEQALQALYDEQNGAPLLRHRITWQRAMRLVEEALAAKEGGKRAD
jgi:hypothetical protein